MRSSLLCVMAAVAACGGEAEAPRSADRFDPPRFESLADPAWSRASGPDDPVLATVDDARITVSAVQRQVDLAGGELDARAALERLVEAELLAQEALRHELNRAPEVLREVKREAVRRLLHDRFVEGLRPEAVAQQDIEQAFRVPQVRARFDHEDGYFVRDVQIVCCAGAADQCRDNADPTCFDQATPLIQSAYEALAPKQPFATPEAFEAEVRLLQEQIPQLVVKTLSFWYKQGVPYEEQRGYTTYFIDWVLAVVAIEEPGRIAPPLRSYHAWHIPLLVQHVPAVHKTPSDPEVRLEIARGILNAIRRRDYSAWKRGLSESYRVQTRPEALQALAGGAPGEE